MKNFDKIVGIDPGAAGGIAVWSKSGLGCKKMPTYEIKKKKLKKDGTPTVSNETDIMELKNIFEDQKKDNTPIVFLERVQMWHGDSEGDNAGKQFRIAKLLANYEKLKACLEMSDIPYIQVRPQDWQSYLNLVIKGESKENRKKRYIRFAAETHNIDAKAWNADAICIMEFGRRKLHFDSDWCKKHLSKTNNPRLI